VARSAQPWGLPDSFSPQQTCNEAVSPPPGRPKAGWAPSGGRE